MGRSPCCDESRVKKGPWSPEEDEILVKYIKEHGHGSWRALPKLAGLNRCGKSCRLRWTNYLRPDIKRGKFSPEEENTILHLHAILGNKWSAIAGHLEGRTDNEIKNYWNTHLKKRLINSGIDPVTHRPSTVDMFSSLPHLLALVNLNELLMGHQSSIEEHTLRLQAEAMAKIQYLQSLTQAPTPQATTSSMVNDPCPNTPSNNNHINGLMDIETLKILSSISQIEDPACGSPSMFGNPSSSQVREDCFSFPRLPELQNPISSFQATPSKENFMKVEEGSLNFTSFQPYKSPKSSSHQLLVNDGDATMKCHGDDPYIITPGFDGISSSGWSDFLLEDPSFSSLLPQIPFYSPSPIP
ncbi:hypothetical protein SAY86_005111 [Trapa natans]|uniref:Uncharacterized protein n=1 Tax=Trapa natans TaxID=22666 RepID=A0AAN7L528_TRANT|nr:hypothetical protein SAY86_005111 [Trapa natans]